MTKYTIYGEKPCQHYVYFKVNDEIPFPEVFTPNSPITNIKLTIDKQEVEDFTLRSDYLIYQGFYPMIMEYFKKKDAKRYYAFKFVHPLLVFLQPGSTYELTFDIQGYRISSETIVREEDPTTSLGLKMEDIDLMLGRIEERKEERKAEEVEG